MRVVVVDDEENVFRILRGGNFLMQVLIYQGPRVMTVEEASQPRAGQDEALLRVQAVGICGSEIEGYLGHNSLRVPPLIMGHEFAGEIVDIGPTDGPKPAPGQRVTVNPLISCGTCVFCQSGRAHLCQQRKLIGAHQPGAFAEYVRVPLGSIVPLPDTLDVKTAALTEPFAVALHGVNLADIEEQDGVVIWGAGSIGLLAISAARLANPKHILAVDTNPSRLEAARVMGATAVFDARDPQIVKTLRNSLTDVPHVVVVDAVGRSITRQLAADVAGPGGEVVMIGLHDKDTTFDANGLIRSEVTIHGSYAYRMTDVLWAVELLAAGHVQTDLWTDVRPLSSGPAAFAELVDTPGAATKIILVPEQ
jgi:threonine dehydrogenase-like Zn-dependent dehydrogenase